MKSYSQKKKYPHKLANIFKMFFSAKRLTRYNTVEPLDITLIWTCKHWCFSKT